MPSTEDAETPRPAEEPGSDVPVPEDAATTKVGVDQVDRVAGDIEEPGDRVPVSTARRDADRAGSDSGEGSLDPQQGRKRRLPSIPGIILGSVTMVWIVQFGLDVFRRHDRFGSFNYDMGIYEQTAWLISQGKTFITVRGLDFFGHHANFGFIFTAPLYWLGLGAGTLNLIQVLSIGLGALALYLIGREWLPNGWWALVIPVAYLLHPSTGWVAWELFHPEVMALTPILFAWWLAIKRRWGWYTVALIWAVSWKEDVAIAVAVLGLIMMLRGRFRAGLITAIAAGAYFVIVSQVISANVPGEVAFYANFYGSLGDSPAEVVKTALTEPSAVVERLNTSNALGYARDVSIGFGLAPTVALLAGLASLAKVLLMPWRRRTALTDADDAGAVAGAHPGEPSVDATPPATGSAAQDASAELTDAAVSSSAPSGVTMVTESGTASQPSSGRMAFQALRAGLDMSEPSALGALLVLLLGVPQFFINVLSIQNFTYDLRYHYVATVLAAMAIASIEILATGVRRYRALPNLILVLTIIIGALGTQTAWGISPLSDRYGPAFWPGESDRYDIFDEAIDLIPSDASLSATYNLVPHVTQREYIYEFPNPWRPWNWGVKDEMPHDGRTVDWLLIDKRVLGQNVDVYDALLDSGSFEIRFEDANVVVAERVNDTLVTGPRIPQPNRASNSPT